MPLLFIGVCLMILKDEIPVLQDWYEQVLEPQHWQARQDCRRLAFQSARQPEFARLVSAAEIHETQQGLYVRRMQIGEMAGDGREVLFGFSCYVDSRGRVVKSLRETD